MVLLKGEPVLRRGDRGALSASLHHDIGWLYGAVKVCILTYKGVSNAAKGTYLNAEGKTEYNTTS